MRTPLMFTLLSLLAGCEGCRDSSADTDAVATSCERPEQILDEAGAPTGYLRCADGAVNRDQVVPVDMAAYEDDLPACHGEEGSPDCQEHSDCTEAPEGRCVGQSNEFVEFCRCTYLCSRDSDCETDEVCLAPEANGTRYIWPRCVPAACITGADCASGECGVAGSQYQSETHYALSCRGAPGVDECRTDDDCSDEVGNVCWPDVDDVWRCQRWHPID
jgi:hypothetical protein